MKNLSDKDYREMLYRFHQKQAALACGRLVREENGMERQILGAETGAKRARGRPRMKMLDWTKKAMRVSTGEGLGD